MRRSYIPRSIERVVSRAIAEFPALVLTGPRQSGKTTLLRRLCSRTHRYVSLEPPDVSGAARSDPRGFLDTCCPPVVLDEIQCAPELLPYIKERIDETRDVKGHYLLTGSQNVLLSEKVTETLAGRAAVLRLLPLSRREVEGRLDDPFPWESKNRRRVRRVRTGTLGLWRGLLRGAYPELAREPGRDAHLWHSSYVQTYLERDVRTIRQVGDLMSFHAFLRLLAARSGQLLDLTDIGRDLGLALNTIKAWLSVLEATHQVIVLRPFFANLGKRFVKTPKVYFTDPGTLCHLVGLRDPEHAANGPMAGAIFETAVLGEIVKTLVHRGEEPRVFFWRTSDGHEVDFLVETEAGLVPVEAKATSTPRPAMAAGIERLQRVLGEQALPGWVVHAGEPRLPLGQGVTAVPLVEL